MAGSFHVDVGIENNPFAGLQGKIGAGPGHGPDDLMAEIVAMLSRPLQLLEVGAAQGGAAQVGILEVGIL